MLLWAALKLTCVQPSLPLWPGAREQTTSSAPQASSRASARHAQSWAAFPHLSLAAFLCRASRANLHSCSRPVALREPSWDSRSCLFHLSLLGLPGPPPSAMMMIPDLVQMLYGAEAKVETAWKPGVTGVGGLPRGLVCYPQEAKALNTTPHTHPIKDLEHVRSRA